MTHFDVPNSVRNDPGKRAIYLIYPWMMGIGYMISSGVFTISPFTTVPVVAEGGSGVALPVLLIYGAWAWASAPFWFIPLWMLNNLRVAAGESHRQANAVEVVDRPKGQPPDGYDDEDDDPDDEPFELTPELMGAGAILVFLVTLGVLLLVAL